MNAQIFCAEFAGVHAGLVDFPQEGGLDSNFGSRRIDPCVEVAGERGFSVMRTEDRSRFLREWKKEMQKREEDRKKLSARGLRTDRRKQRLA